MSALYDSISERNYREARVIYDRWYDQRRRGWPRDAGWVRLVAALDTESKAKILAHGGGWSGGNRTNQAQRILLAQSTRLYREATGRDPDGVGNNGGSVGALQQIPTLVARLADKPWNGWGDLVECMVLATSVPKFLDQLRVTDNRYYGKVPIAGLMPGAEILADLLRVQQPAEDEVAANYGTEIVPRVQQIAAQFPQALQSDWFTTCFKEQ